MYLKKESIFAKKLGYKEDEISFLGSGDFGEAFETINGKVIKITSDRDEFLCAHKLLGKNNNHLADIYDLIIFNDHSYGILMEKLETDGVEDVFDEVMMVADEQRVGLTEIDEDDLEYELSYKAKKMARELYLVSRESNDAGFHSNDIHERNIGLKSNGNYGAFDQKTRDQKQYIDHEFEDIKHLYIGDCYKFFSHKTSELEKLKILDDIENQKEVLMTLYHGSDSDFDGFNSAYQGKRMTSLGLANYLTPSYEMASEYGSNVMTFECNIKNIFDWDDLSDTKRELIELALLECIPKDRIAGFGKEIEVIVPENKEGLSKFRELQEQTKDYYHEYARAQIKDYNNDGTITISYRESKGLELANNQQLMTLMNEYSPNLISNLGYKSSKFGNQIAIYDSEIPKRVYDNLDLSNFHKPSLKKPFIGF